MIKKLETQVAEKTEALAATNEALRREIAERKRVEEEMRVSEARFRGAFDHAPIGMTLTRPDGGFLEVNHAICRMLGYSERELLERNFQSLTHPDDLEENVKMFRKVLAGESDLYQTEKRLFHRDGRIVRANVTGTLVRNAEGEPLYFVAQIQDITEQRRVEEQFRQSEEHFRQLAENITEVFWMTNPDKNEILYVSPGYERIWGRTCRSAYESPGTWMEAIHPEDRARVMKSVKENQAEGLYDEEYRIVRPDGSIRWIWDRAFPIRDKSGKVYRVTGIAEDITDRRRAGEALRESEERLRLAINSARMYTWDWDVQTGRVVRSGHYAAVYGSEVLVSDSDYASFIRMVHPDDRKKVEASGSRILEGKGNRFDFRIVRPNGEIRWLETQGLAHYDAAGKVVRVIGVTQDITERKQAEEALRTSEERFRRYFDLGLIGMAITSPVKGWIEVNAQICEILGYDRSALLRKTWAELTHPDDLAADVLQFDRIVSGEIDGYSMDKRFVRRDGRVIQATISVKCVRRPDGSVDYLVGLLQDITERKGAEARLAYQAHLLTHVGEAIIATDDQFRVTVWNLAAEKIYGWKAEEVLGRTVREVVRSNLTEAQRAEAIEAIAKEGFYHSEVVHTRKDGRQIDIQGYTIVLRDALGRITGYVSANRDITERKRVEEALRKSDERFHLIARATNDAVWDWDLTTNTVWWNESFKPLFCYRSADIEPRLEWWTDRFHPEDRERVLSGVQAAIESGDPIWTDEYRFLRGDGLYAAVLDRGYIVHDERGKAVRMIGAMMDITERKEAEKAMADYARRLQSLSGQLLEAQEAERRRIARELHDEIGQSLTAVKIQLHAARGHPEDRLSRVEECLGVVDQALSQVRSLSLDLHPPQLDELGLAATLRWHLDRQGHAANIATRFAADPLPARLRPDLEIACFRVAQEALTNVIRHAGAREVSVELRASGGELHLIVEDDGRGFDMEVARERAMQGASMGLVGMQERADLAGGRLELTSAPGQGTRLHVFFPMAETASRRRSKRRKG